MTAASLEPILELSTHLPLLVTVLRAIVSCAFSGTSFIFAALSY